MGLSNHLVLGTKIDYRGDHWWCTCGEYYRHIAYHHDSKLFEVAIHPTKAPVPLVINIRYDH